VGPEEFALVLIEIFIKKMGKFFHRRLRPGAHKGKIKESYTTGGKVK
jgi:hypothetical protein